MAKAKVRTLLQGQRKQKEQDKHRQKRNELFSVCEQSAAKPNATASECRNKCALAALAASSLVFTSLVFPPRTGRTVAWCRWHTVYADESQST